MNTDRINSITINSDTTIINALKKMDEFKVKLLLLTQKGNFISLISIGDLQRAIINNYPLETPVSRILRKKIYTANISQKHEDIKKYMLKNKTECMPILGENNKLIDVIFWEDLFKEKLRNEEILDLSVIIMAGGRGIRMQPLTNIIPKALIPLDEKTITEHIINNFQKIGCSHFYFSVNYKSNTIKDYFNQLDKDYIIEYFEEREPLGTAGSLHLLDGKIDKTFFMSNCDILIEDDYREIYKYHKKYNNELTIVGSFRNYPIPYGTLKTGNNGRLISLQEKPQLSFLINSGMYILEPHLINEIPKNKFFHITDLIDKILKREGQVGVFPVSEGSWKDIGTWSNYLFEINKKKNYN